MPKRHQSESFQINFGTRELSQTPSDQPNEPHLKISDELADARARGLLTDPAIERGVETNLKLLDQHFEIVERTARTLGDDLT